MYVKYPRTPHLPWTESMTSDDRILQSPDGFVGKRVVVTEKMDGENSTLYENHLHARSLSSVDHPSRHWLKEFWSGIRRDIPPGYRICGENLFAQHSIHYDALPSYFLGFSIWNSENECLSWDESVEWFRLLNITHVPVLYDGLWDEKAIKGLWSGDRNQEGYVVRIADSFKYEEFGQVCAKFVRAKHVQTDQHWMQREVIKNGILSS